MWVRYVRERWTKGACRGVLRLLRCMLLRVYSNCVALKGMLSRVYSPEVPWSYLMSMFVEGKQQLRADSS